MKLFFLVPILVLTIYSFAQQKTEYVVKEDTTFFKRIISLKNGEGAPDFSEPLTQKYLNSGDYRIGIQNTIRISPDNLLYLGFDNDIIDYTDRFYTNGLCFSLIGPLLSENILNHLLLPYWDMGLNYYGITLVQNMYTPATTKVGGIHYGDRPYSAYLLAGAFKITIDRSHQFRQRSKLSVGVIGPLSFGSWIQEMFHAGVQGNDEPLGWEYQIKTDLVLNYDIQYEKGIINSRYAALNLVANSSIGTLYTNTGGGFHFMTGWMNPYFINLGIAKRPYLITNGLRMFQFIFFFKGSAKLVGYDATLVGGMFNRTSSYIIPSESITRLVCQTSAGIALSWRGARIDAEQFLLSPEFHDGLWHKWVHIALTFAL
jgi:hypothetical protein